MKLIRLQALSILAASIALTSAGAGKKVAETMSVARCQAILKNGNQCQYQAESGCIYCWRHKGMAKVIGNTMDDAGEGASKAWSNTKSWTTNAWESTKRGANKAWNATKDAADDARVGVVELFGGKDAKADTNKNK